MITVRDLRDNIEMQGNIVIRVFDEGDGVVSEIPFENCVADWGLDSEVQYMFVECVDIRNMTDAPAIIIEVRKGE